MRSEWSDRRTFQRAAGCRYRLRAGSKKLENVEGVLFTVAAEFHLEAEVCVAVKPTALVDVLGPHSDEPVLAVAHVGAELHNHVSELVQVGPRAEVLDGFVLKLTDLLW